MRWGGDSKAIENKGKSIVGGSDNGNNFILFHLPSS